jgi:hypothetical protein
MPELDLDDKTPAMFSSTGVSMHSALKDITIACEAELTRTQIYPRTERVIKRILETAQKALVHG